MIIRCLGIASDLMLMEGVSTVEDCGDHKVIRTPSEPNFWFGNFVLFDACPDEPSAQIAAFDTAFPGAKHKLIMWDDPAMVPGAGHEVLRAKGFEIEQTDVLTLTQPLQRAPVPAGIEIRAVKTDAEWVQVIDLQTEIGIEEGHDPASHRPYVEQRFATIRGQVEAGRCAWFGAWDGDTFAGDLGIMFNDQMARYRLVETRKSHRRRGICPALLCAAYDWAIERAPQATPIIVAMADSDAGRIYRRCGFDVHEVNVDAVLKGY